MALVIAVEWYCTVCEATGDAGSESQAEAAYARHKCEPEDSREVSGS
jgi:hypothetical protein